MYATDKSMSPRNLRVQELKSSAHSTRIIFQSDVRKTKTCNSNSTHETPSSFSPHAQSSDIQLLDNPQLRNEKGSSSLNPRVRQASSRGSVNLASISRTNMARNFKHKPGWWPSAITISQEYRPSRASYHVSHNT